MNNALAILDDPKALEIYRTDQELVELTEIIGQQTLTQIAQKPPLNELMDQRDNMCAFEAWLLPKTRSRDAYVEARNNIEEALGRLVREIGLWLKEAEKQHGARPSDTGYRDGTPLEPPTLADMNIDKKQSSQYQAIAAIPEDKFEDRIATAKENGWELSLGGLAKYGRNYKKKAAQQMIREKVAARKAGTLPIDPAIHAALNSPSVSSVTGIFTASEPQEKIINGRRLTNDGPGGTWRSADPVGFKSSLFTKEPVYEDIEEES